MEVGLDFSQLGRPETKVRRADDTRYLLGAAQPYDRTGHLWVAENPLNRHFGGREPAALANRMEPLNKFQILMQPEASEVRVTESPITLWKCLNALRSHHPGEET